MKFFPILLICAAAVALMPSQAQGRRGSKRPTATPSAVTTDAAAEAAAPKTGVRFVVCSPSGVAFPSPLYVRSGKEFKAITVGSRTPSDRVKPVGGVIDFWDKDPGVAADMAGNGKSSAAAKLPPPVFSVKTNASVDSKAVCILIPSKEIQKTTTLFLNEKDFPRKGVHIINLSSFPLQIITSEQADYKDKKESKIGVFMPENGICASNSWSFKGEKGQQVNFVLSYADKSAKAYKRLKASSFMLSDRQSVLNVVVKDQTRNIPKIMTIQLSDAK